MASNKDDESLAAEAAWRASAIAYIKREGWRIVKLAQADTDASGDAWTSYYIKDEV
jgi:hypothetical protein